VSLPRFVYENLFSIAEACDKGSNTKTAKKTIDEKFSYVIA
jgi:hypothetical protein